MDFREIKDVCKFCQESGFEFSTQHDRVLETADERIAVELRSGLDYSEIESGSVDGLFSFNAMLPFLEYCLIKGKRLHRIFLKESSKVLKEGKPLILVKNGRMSRIPFQLRLYRPHKSIELFL
ncbi:MAG: hypothetical protein U9O41_06875 [Candidatus Aerophobetes bacterium]|nr:hypothetical protein [Candidatus Aerophobetes bacterium]